MKKRKTPALQASYTIEAALLMPLFLAVLMKGLLLGIDGCRDVEAAAADHAQLEDASAAERIWHLQLADDLLSREEDTQ